MQQQKKAMNDAVNDLDVETFYQRHAPPIFAYLRMHTGSHEDAEDLLVDIFLKALEYPYFHELSEDERRSWIWRVARNKVIDYFRSMKRRHGFPLDKVAETIFQDEEIGPEQCALRQEEYSQLQANINNLSTMQQQVLQLHFVYGLRCTEIAIVLGKREGAVRSLLSRALNALRRLSENREEQNHERFR